MSHSKGETQRNVQIVEGRSGKGRRIWKEEPREGGY